MHDNCFRGAKAFAIKTFRAQIRRKWIPIPNKTFSRISYSGFGSYKFIIPFSAIGIGYKNYLLLCVVDTKNLNQNCNLAQVFANALLSGATADPARVVVFPFPFPVAYCAQLPIELA